MKNRKLVCGVGINDANYVVQRDETTVVNGKQKRKTVWVCPHYQTWKGMLTRCYSTKYQERHPTYRGCSVSEEWLTFSSFRAWMETQDWQDKQLDKDLLFEGNKVYGPKRCVFVTQVVNKFTTDCGTVRGELPIGVCWDKGANKFKSQCRNPFTKKREYLGLFTCEQEAHQAWLKRKLELAKELAANQTDERVAKALIVRYTNYKQLTKTTFGLFIMSEHRDMWIREWRYDKTTSKWVEFLSLYDDSGEWVDSVTSEEFIQLYYYVKEHIKSHDDHTSVVNGDEIPDYSHLYEIAEDDSIDSPSVRISL